MIQRFRHEGSPHPSKTKRAAKCYGLIGLVLPAFMLWGARPLSLSPLSFRLSADADSGLPLFVPLIPVMPTDSRK
jgi:hypothetical protein